MAALLHLALQRDYIENARPFILALTSKRRSNEEKAFILKAFNKWKYLTNVWFQFADVLPEIELLVEDADFPAKDYAALLSSKVYFCLGLYDRALALALRAGDLFNVVPNAEFGLESDSEYVDKMVQVAIDTFKVENKKNHGLVDSQISGLITKIVNRNLEKKENWMVIALGYELGRLDILRRGLEALDENLPLRDEYILLKTLRLAFSASITPDFRYEIILTVLARYESCTEKSIWRICQGWIQVNEFNRIADLLCILVEQGKEPLAYQLAFDVYENSNPQFMFKMNSRMENSLRPKAPPGAKYEPGHSPGEKLKRILRGDETIRQRTLFYCRHNKVDHPLLQELKDSTRSAVACNGLIIAQGFTSYGTTSHRFMKAYPEWVSRATNWNKFNAVASLGLIHIGQEQHAMSFLRSYMPSEGRTTFGYQEGGAYFAYGLMHIARGNKETLQNFLEWLRDQSSPKPMRHGACLGAAVAHHGQQNEELYSQMRAELSLDDALTGEAAGMGIGMIYAGSMNPPIFEELKAILNDTPHDKIQRGIRFGIACLAYGVKQNCEKYVADLIGNKSNPMMRATGVSVLSMAYVGTGDPDVVRRLLEKVASDPNNDVKRLAAMGIGFVLCHEIEECISYCSMLVEHFNGFVRYGAVMALAIACASTGNMDAITVLEPVLSDKENYVRSGAFIATALIMVQQNEYTCSKSVNFRKHILRKVTEKVEDQLVIFGSYVAHGIMDFGGKNAFLSIKNRHGEVDCTSTIGFLGFLHGWYWHSAYNFLAMAAKPACIILINPDFKMPLINLYCSARAVLFGYPPMAEVKKEREAKRIEAAVLSVTGKRTLRRDARKRLVMYDEAPEKVDLSAKIEKKSPALVDPRSWSMVQNPARVAPALVQYVQMTVDFEYKLQRSIVPGGIIIAVKDPKSTCGDTFINDIEPTQPEKRTIEPLPHSTFEIDLADFA